MDKPLIPTGAGFQSIHSMSHMGALICSNQEWGCKLLCLMEQTKELFSCSFQTFGSKLFEMVGLSRNSMSMIGTSRLGAHQISSAQKRHACDML